MEARARIFGHPIHQMLIPVPFGLFTTAALLDVAARFFDVQALSVVSFWNLAIGVVTALLAAVFGAIDWSAIPRGTRAKRVGAIHGLSNVVAVVLFSFALLLRADEPYFAVPTLALVVEIAALAIAMFAGWLGGELVDRLAIGVDPNAHPDHHPRRDHSVVRREVIVGEATPATPERASYTRDTPPYGAPTAT